MHEHEHHGHSHVTPDALLSHMAEHNESHVKELEALAAQLHGAAAEKAREAAGLYRKGNALLAQALEALKENA